MNTIKYVVTIEIGRILMHNGQTADPLNEYAQQIKQITNKRQNKTVDDHKELSRLEFEAGLWLDSDGKPAIPDCAVEKMFETAAGKVKRGGATSAKSTVNVLEDFATLKYDGPSTIEELWADKRFVMRRIVNPNPSAAKPTKGVRTRPIFRNTSCSFTLCVADGSFGSKEVEDVLTFAGANVGLGDWRPKYGRFVVKSIKRVG
jgi:hypothetical protein